MKLTFLIGAAALATGAAVAADESMFHALNRTDASLTTRHLQVTHFFRMVGVDIVGKDIGDEKAKDVFECLGRNYGKPRNGGTVCTGVTWTNYNGGWCWMKGTDYHGAPSAPKAEADTYIALQDSVSAFIWSGTKDGFDMVGGFDIDNKPGSTIGKCFEVCNANDACYAVTWTDYNGGTCWLKSRASGFIPKAGAKSAYVARRKL